MLNWHPPLLELARRGVPLLGAAVLAASVVSKVLRRSVAEIHKRGVVILDAVPRRRIAHRRNGGIGFAGVRISAEEETKHFKIIGTTGTGKSTAIRNVLGAALERGDRAVIADPDSGYRARFFRRYRGDVVLNPFEAGSMKWDPFSEIFGAGDAEQLANALIASSNDPAAGEWRGYARTFLSALLRGCRISARRDCAELWRLLSAAPAEELRPLIAGSPAQPFLDAENTRMFGSIRSVAVSALAALEHIQSQRAAPFSVRRWVRSRSSRGALFITYRAGQIAALRSMIATWMRLAIFEAMNADEGRDQRIWFVVDELDALGAIDGLKDALARLRKFGGRCILGFQSLAQVHGTYGSDANTIVENCGNTLILRSSASENGGTSQFASRLIGDREVLRRHISRGSDRESALWGRGARRSRSTSEQHIIEPAVMPSQIEKLADFCGYLKTASSPDWLKVSFARMLRYDSE